VHEEGYQAARGPDRSLRFRRPDGRALLEVPEAPRRDGDPVAQLRAHHAAQGRRLGPHTAHPDWAGERLDLGWAIDVLHPRANPLSK
jgi:hypothetical protein